MPTTPEMSAPRPSSAHDGRGAPPPSAGDPLSVAIGADIGGTSTRIALAPAETAGAVETTRAAANAGAAGTAGDPRPGHTAALLDRAIITHGPGANLRSSGTAALAGVAAPIAEAITRAHEQWGRAVEVGAVFAGMSGAGAARHAEVLTALQDALVPLGIARDRIEVGSDLLTAFLTGGVGDDGVLLLAGTGAVAVRFRARVIQERLDGMGWLLGDVGSAVWLGRRTLEAVAADLDRRGPRTALTELLSEELGIDLRPARAADSPTGDPRQDLIRALDDEVPVGRPAALGRFGPLPARAAEDPVARRILDDAIQHLVEQVRRLDPERSAPVVLAGSVLTADGPVHHEVTHALATEGRTIAIAPDGLAGALQLALEAAR